VTTIGRAAAQSVVARLRLRGMKRTQHGLSMIELVVVMSIVGILMAIGTPSYRYVTTANRISGEINGLLGDFQFARAEAIREGQTVSVCATNDGTTCSGTATWSKGWLVFSDTSTLGSIDGTDQILRVQKALSGGDTLVADAANYGAITFNREGFAQGMPGQVYLKLHNSTSVNQFTRCLAITVVGAFSTQKYGGGCT
jgi:type IV fimbrial biogenesis protein FimT